MDLKHLRTFISVAEIGSLSRASDRLRRAQPALSRQIKILEDTVGFPLFVRHSRGMTLTEQGKELFDRLGGLVRQMERSIEDVRSLSSTVNGQVALGLMPSVSYVLSGRIARRVASELPGVSLRIVEGYAGHLVEWLQRGEIDATLLYGPAADFHLRIHDLLYEELVLVGPGDSDLDPKRKVTFATLSRHQLILPSRPHGLRRVVDSAAGKAKVELNIRFEADSFRVLKDMVVSGLGFTILPRSAIADERKDGVLRLAPLHRPQLTRQIVLALPSERVDTRASGAVVNIVLREIAGMVKAGQWQAFPSKFLAALTQS